LCCRLVTGDKTWIHHWDRESTLESKQSDVGPLLQRVTACLKSVADWMSTNRLQLNSDKTEFMWLTTARSQHRLPTSDPLMGSTPVSPSAAVRDLGIFIDQDLTMKTHLQRTASRCFATLRQLRSIRRYVPTPVFQSLVSALVLSRLDQPASHPYPSPSVSPKCRSKAHLQPETLRPHH